MDLPEPKWLSYQRVRQQMQRIRSIEVPVEFAVSLPMPTLRWGTAAFAHFAAPAIREPEGPTTQASPDRWWMIDARNAHLIVYALCDVVAFATNTKFDRAIIHSEGVTIEHIRERHQQLDQAMNDVVPQFFAGQAGAQDSRRHVAALLVAVIPQSLMPIYRSLTPDFFNWLDA